MRVVALLLGLMLAACGTDGGKDGPLYQQRLFDGTVTAALSAYAEVTEDNFEVRALDLSSCQPDLAPDGSFCTLQAQVQDFEEDSFLAQLGGTTVKVFPSNRIDDLTIACAAPASAQACPAAPPTCYQGNADANGRLDFPCIPCNSRHAVWTYKESAITPVTKKAVEFDRWLDAGDGVQGVYTISVATYSLIPGIAGYQPNPALGIVAGEANDCGNSSIANLAANVDRGDLTAPITEEFAGDDPVYGVGTFYFVNETPQKNQTVTSRDGLWAFVNVPPSRITVFVSGRRTDGGPVEHNLGRVSLSAFPDTITIGDLRVRNP
jgi:hypothetical protein